jgi:hypothetical protein
MHFRCKLARAPDALPTRYLYLRAIGHHGRAPPERACFAPRDGAAVESSETSNRWVQWRIFQLFLRWDICTQGGRSSPRARGLGRPQPATKYRIILNTYDAFLQGLLSIREFGCPDTTAPFGDANGSRTIARLPHMRVGVCTDRAIAVGARTAGSRGPAAGFGRAEQATTRGDFLNLTKLYSRCRLSVRRRSGFRSTGIARRMRNGACASNRDLEPTRKCLRATAAVSQATRPDAHRQARRCASVRMKQRAA